MAELAFLFGTACGCILGYAAGLLALLRQGIYCAMIALTLAQMAFRGRF